MADKSKIEWTDATWNPAVGCTKVSPGCDHCYAEGVVNRFAGTSPAFPTTFDVVNVRSDRFLTQPLRWGKPRLVFVNSLSDLFHADVSDEFIAEVWAVMAACPQHVFQLLTKRHGRMRSLLSSPRWPELLVSRAHWPRDVDPELPLPNVWLGVSVEDQTWARTRLPALMDTPAAVRWVSAEPLLGPLDLALWLYRIPEPTTPVLDWVVVGGESGPGARPMHPAWARQIRDECEDAGVPFLFKQWGAYVEDTATFPSRAAVSVPPGPMGYPPGEGPATVRMLKLGKHDAGRLLDGCTWDGYPTEAVSRG